MIKQCNLLFQSNRSASRHSRITMLAAIFLTLDFFFSFFQFSQTGYCIDLLQRDEVKHNFDILEVKFLVFPLKNYN